MNVLFYLQKAEFTKCFLIMIFPESFFNWYSQNIQNVITILYHKVDEHLSLAFTPKEKMAACLAASIALWFKVIGILVSLV
jgi:hypothetical protein